MIVFFTSFDTFTHPELQANKSEESRGKRYLQELDLKQNGQKAPELLGFQQFWFQPTPQQQPWNNTKPSHTQVGCLTWKSVAKPELQKRNARKIHLLHCGTSTGFSLANRNILKSEIKAFKSIHADESTEHCLASLPWNILSTTQTFSVVHHSFTAPTCCSQRGAKPWGFWLGGHWSKSDFFFSFSCHLLVFENYSQQLQLQQGLSCLSPEPKDPYLESSLLQG